uniref:Gfo/Idh/MocA family protein n=1 Tax=Frankia sp. Cr1 TaxID=3073931 RepID=UPI002AD5129E
MGRLQVGVVGCGIVARSRYFPLLRKLSDGFAVARLCDIDTAALDHACRLFPEAERYSSLVDLAQARGSSLDAVLLLTDGDHHDLLLTLAEHGLPTFVEKPISYTRGRAVECVREFEVRGLPLQVGYMKR